MSKKFIGIFLGLALCMVAVPASAASLSQTQISAIIGLLQSFGADQSTINQVAVTLGGSAPVTNTQCVDLSRDLTIGANSDQVLMLQRYLKNKGFFTEEPTGYYGFVTAQAVGRLQVSLGIVSSSQDRSYGLMGPRTREMVKCGYPQTSAASISIVTPNGGESIPFVSMYNYDTYPIRITQKGISSANIALYKNDQFYRWIAQNVDVSGNSEYVYKWAPNPDDRIYMDLDTLGSVFKIYVTGYKSDGTGYINDTSDGTFRFVHTNTRQAIADVILKMATGLMTKDYRFDLNKDVKITSADSLLYLQGQNPATEVAIPECTTAQSKRGQNSQNYTCVCPVGFARGVVWGGVVGIDPSSNPESLYTDDSNICTAAIHIGEAAGREAFYVTYKILPGQSSYIGTTANGITTRSYGPWPGSFKIGIKG